MDLVPKEYKKTNSQNLNIKEGRARAAFNFLKIKEFSLKPWIIICFILLVLSLLAYGALIFYKKSVSSQVDGLKSKQAETWNKLDKNLVEKLIEFQQSSEIISELLKSHKYPSKLISALAAVTLPQVQWESFNLNGDLRQITLKGGAASYKVLAQQISTFEQDAEIWQKPEVSAVSLDKKGSVGFILTVYYNPTIMQ